MTLWRILAVLAAASPGWAHETPTTKLTWNREISRLFEKRCMGCHQEGGRAPMAFRTFAQARPWAVAIKEEVLRRTMPPWGAAKGYGEFANDISLPQEEINQIAEWAEGGSPEGDPQLRKPNFSVPLWKEAPAPRARIVDRPASGAIVAVRATAKGKRWVQHADGTVTPLVWVVDPKPRIRQWMILREPIRMTPGAKWLGGPLEAMLAP